MVLFLLLLTAAMALSGLCVYSLLPGFIQVIPRVVIGAALAVAFYLVWRGAVKMD
jgi:hypothetical protein